MKSKINFTVQDIQEALTFWMREKRGIEITEFHRIEAEGVNSSLRVYAEVSQEELEGTEELPEGWRTSGKGRITGKHLGFNVSLVPVRCKHYVIDIASSDNIITTHRLHFSSRENIIARTLSLIETKYDQLHRNS